MNKKAIFFGLFTDMTGWLIFFIGMIAWFLIFSLALSDVKHDISADGVYMDDKSMLINILQTPIEDSTNVADEIIMSINRNRENPLLKEGIDSILNGVYGRAKPVCWARWYYTGNTKKTLMDVECMGKKKELFDETTFLPFLPNEGPIEIKLTVLGYAE